MSYVFCLRSSVFGPPLPSSVFCLMSSVLCLMSSVFCLLSSVFGLLSSVSGLPSPVFRLHSSPSWLLHPSPNLTPKPSLRVVQRLFRSVFHEDGPHSSPRDFGRTPPLIESLAGSPGQVFDCSNILKTLWKNWSRL
jgi:hypothetical protein